MGPGAADRMSIRADETLKKCDTIIGYTVYVNLLKEDYPGKEYLTTPMTQEARRCEMAFEEAQKGKTVAMVCSGDVPKLRMMTIAIPPTFGTSLFWFAHNQPHSG